MKTSQYSVRIIHSSSNPHLPSTESKKLASNSKKNLFASRESNLIIGSGIGFFAGIIIFLMFKFIGVNYGGLETSLIIGLPSLLGLIASFVVH
jgi:hypothetical protein